MKRQRVLLGGLALLLPFSQSAEARDLRRVEDLMSETAIYDTNIPSMSPSEKGHAVRMRGYAEARALTELEKETFLPIADLDATLKDLPNLMQAASQYLTVSGQQTVESILLQSVSKDAKAEAGQKSLRQLQFLLEDLAEQEARSWSHSTDKMALEGATLSVGDVLESRVRLGLCSRRDSDLEMDRRQFEALAQDPTIERLARNVYSRVTDLISREISLRLPQPPPPVGTPLPPPAPACVPTMGLRDVATRELVESSLGLHISALKRMDLEVDIGAWSLLDQVKVQLDSNLSYFLTYRNQGRSKVRLEVLRLPAQTIAGSIRLLALDAQRQVIGELNVPVILGGQGQLLPLPADPVVSRTNVVALAGGRVIAVAPGAKLDLVKGDRAMVSADIMDQYGLLMRTAPVQLSIVNGPERIELLPTQGGQTQIFAKRVVDDQQRTEVRFEVASIGFGSGPQPGPGHGGPGNGPGHGPGHGSVPGNGLTGVLLVNTVFAPFGGFSDQEARALTERLYMAILQRSADFPGADGYVRKIKKGGLRGLRDAAVEIVKSVEFRQGVGSNPRVNGGQIVDSFYQHLLGRAADAGGKAFYQPAVEAGKAQDVVVSLVESVEFRDVIVGR